MKKPNKQTAAVNHRINRFFIILFTLFISIPAFPQERINTLTYPEIDEIEKVINADERPDGVVFVIYEDEYDALEWVMPRLTFYIELLRKEMGGIPIAIVSHGEEILSLTDEQQRIFPEVHESIINITEKYQVPFHVCGAFASLNGLSEEDFPAYVDVVPYGPAQIADYRMVGYEMIDVALSW